MPKYMLFVLCPKKCRLLFTFKVKACTNCNSSGFQRGFFNFFFHLYVGIFYYSGHRITGKPGWGRDLWRSTFNSRQGHRLDFVKLTLEYFQWQEISPLVWATYSSVQFFAQWIMFSYRQVTFPVSILCLLTLALSSHPWKNSVPFFSCTYILETKVWDEIPPETGLS